MSEREQRIRWTAACRLDSVNATRHTRICSMYFEEGLNPLPVPLLLTLPQHLKSRTDPEGRPRKQRKETPQASKDKKLFTSHEKQDVKPERMDYGSKEEYSAFEVTNTPYFRPLYVDTEVQTNLTAPDIEVMADCKEKLENNT